MDTIADRIKLARHRAGMTMSQVADVLGITTSAVGQWESGRTRVHIGRALTLADALNVSVQWLIEGDGPIDQPTFRNPKKYAPVVNTVVAGSWGDVTSREHIPEDSRYIELDTNPVGFSLALELEGESMLPEFHPGDLIVIDTGLDPQPGDFVVAAINNDAQSTFKKYRLKGQDTSGSPIIELLPLNPDYPTLTINAENPGRIIGTMIEHRRYRRR